MQSCSEANFSSNSCTVLGYSSMRENTIYCGHESQVHSPKRKSKRPFGPLKRPCRTPLTTPGPMPTWPIPLSWITTWRTSRRRLLYCRSWTPNWPGNWAGTPSRPGRAVRLARDRNRCRKSSDLQQSLADPPRPPEPSVNPDVDSRQRKI